MNHHVTDVLQILSNGFRSVGADTLERARQLGTAVHQHALSTIADPDLTLESTDPEVAGYVRKVLTWYDEHVLEVVAVEKRFEWEAIGIVGRIDLIARMKGDRLPAIIDLKRVATVQLLAGFQTAAYREGAAHCLKIKTGRRFALHVPKIGDCRAIEFSNPNDWRTFLGALALYKELLAIGYLKKKMREDESTKSLRA